MHSGLAPSVGLEWIEHNIADPGLGANRGRGGLQLGVVVCRPRQIEQIHVQLAHRHPPSAFRFRLRDRTSRPRLSRTVTSELWTPSTEASDTHHLKRPGNPGGSPSEPGRFSSAY